MKLKNIAVFFVTLGLVLSLANNVQAISLVDNIPCATGEADCTPCDFVQLFVNASNILVGVSGAFAMLMFVYSGIVLITAYGNEARIKWGKDILIATVIGIFIVMLAWTFINVVTGAVLGVDNPVTRGWFETISVNSEAVGSGQYGGVDAETREQIQSLPGF